ncbi:c-type cytochrome [Noviherbaspirillum sp. ST9]|uniref:c-type cytochrome n=1 Tax=Noviherbaspirillum sp. ST9 TaxID=3401606 RepID=UPI003B58A8BA
MKRKAIALGVASIAATAMFFFSKPQSGFIDPSDSEMVAKGKNIYAAHCAACHGANLEGQPEWRKRLPNGRLPAPPHDGSGHTWHHPDAVLVDIVKNSLVPGRTAPDGYQSDMPAYANVLSDTDIAAVLAYIKSTWPPEALAMQKELSLRR